MSTPKPDDTERGQAARDEILKARTFKLNATELESITRVGTAKEQLQAIACFLRRGTGVTISELYRLGIDPWGARAATDEHFRVRAAAALDLLADGFEQ